MFSRLTRWLDRHIPFNFQVEHKPGANIGFGYRTTRFRTLNRSAHMIVCSRLQKLVKLDPLSDSKRKIFPKVNSSLQRPIIMNAFVIH